MRFVIIIVAAASVACYQYAPPGSVPPRPGTDVRIQISDDKATELGVVGDNGVFLLTGELVRYDGDTVGVRVSERGWSSAQTAVRAHRTFMLPRHTVIAMETKHIRKWETAALVVGGVGAFAILVATVEVKQQGTGGDIPPRPDRSLVRRFP